MLSQDQLLAYLIENAEAWVREQREIHRPTGRELTSEERNALGDYFEEDILGSARVATVPNIANPEFYQELMHLGFPMPLDFRQMSGITFDDTILLSQAKPAPAGEHMALLFHELVHVVQYSILGINEFIERYIVGWADNEFMYDQIPLEKQAYDLQARYRAALAAPFAVAALVRKFV